MCWILYVLALLVFGKYLKKGFHLIISTKFSNEHKLEHPLNEFQSCDIFFGKLKFHKLIKEIFNFRAAEYFYTRNIINSFTLKSLCLFSARIEKRICFFLYTSNIFHRTNSNPMHQIKQKGRSRWVRQPPVGHFLIDISVFINYCLGRCV